MAKCQHGKNVGCMKCAKHFMKTNNKLFNLSDQKAVESLHNISAFAQKEKLKKALDKARKENKRR